VPAGGDGVGFAVRQHVRRPVGVHVDQDRAVGMPAAKGEVVDAEHLDAPRLRQRPCADQSDQHVTAARHGDLSHQTRSGTASQAERHVD